MLPIDTNAQIIKTNNSLSANWSNNGAKKIYKYNPTIGLEYLESSHFLLSSSIGVSHKNQEYPIFNGESTIETNIKYLEISTTGRFKFNTNDISFFIGIGPTIETIQETEEYTCLTMRLKSRQVKLTGTISAFYVSMIPSASSM